MPESFTLFSDTIMDSNAGEYAVEDKLLYPTSCTKKRSQKFKLKKKQISFKDKKSAEKVYNAFKNSSFEKALINFSCFRSEFSAI